MYGVAIVLGVLACIATAIRFRRNYRRKISMAARLLSYKISLTVADLINLFIYAPTQLFWINSYWVDQNQRGSSSGTVATRTVASTSSSPPSPST